MTDNELLGAQWKRAAEVLGVECQAPFTLESANGKHYEFACLLPAFGAPSGTLVSFRYEREAVEAAESQGYTHSTMGPEKRLPFELESFKECLIDWSWVREDADPPGWYPQNGV
jgi:hypothetical protein